MPNAVESTPSVRMRVEILAALQDQYAVLEETRKTLRKTSGPR